jgi:hypothetical protein
MIVRNLTISSGRYVGIKHSNHPVQRKSSSSILYNTGQGECCCSADMSLSRPVGIKIYDTRVL